MSEEQQELKPCPFCGGGAKIHELMDATSYYVFCSNGEYDEYDHPNESPCVFQPESKQLFSTRERAARAWNSRAALDASQQSILAKLREPESVEAVASSLFEHEKATMGEAWYHPSETFRGLGDTASSPWKASAQAAINAIETIIKGDA